MIQVLSGFAIVWVIILIGYFIGRTNVLGPNAESVLSRTAFFVASPALLFETLAQANIKEVLGPQMGVAALSAFAAVGLYFLIARFLFRKRTAGELVIGALSSSMVNSANLGIPIATYVLGSASFAAPVLMFQLAIYTPIYVTALDTITGEHEKHVAKIGPDGAPVQRVRPPWHVTLGRIGLQILKNPLIVGSFAGILFSWQQWPVPDVLNAPVELIAGAAVPCMLLAFGISLVGSKPLQKSSNRRMDVGVATVLKLVAQPIIAFFLAQFLFQLEGHQLLAAVVLASLPAAQNVFVAASRYQVGLVVAKDSVLVTTIAAIPAMIAIALLLN
ncbi:AEC family transporter [Micrococcoides hystricis]|uniref:AEC family transporter n=1 Tax=Micrococcoides hystricis TaxID=1572761 RepID=A0ABV6PDK9_9MICC